MANIRKVVFANDQIYHVYNRGIEKRTIFEDAYDYKRAYGAIKFYLRSDLHFRFSYYLHLDQKERLEFDMETHNNLIEIVSYCLMPNHFHFLIKQLSQNGIREFISNFSNSYTKYFNTKYERSGHLFQGTFKAVRVEDDEQLIHVSRYIHLNPVASFLIKDSDLFNYRWSSLPEYFSNEGGLCEKRIILDQFQNIKAYKEFLVSQIKKAQDFEVIKHLSFDG